MPTDRPASCSWPALWAFRAACIVLILTGALHASSHFAPEPPPASDAERQLQDLSRSVEFEVPGAKLTLHKILTGFSWHFALSLTAFGVLGIALAWSRRADPIIRRTCAAVIAASLLIAAVNSQVYFFIIPTALISLAALLMGLAFALAPRSGNPSAQGQPA